MGRRRDELDARGREAHLGDPGIDLGPGKLAALARLRALGHLDLEIRRVDEILARHAEASGGDLLDGAPARVPVGVGCVARRVLTALAGVRSPTDAVHGDGQGLVRLLADRSVGHRAGGEALQDRLDRLDLLERERRRGRPELDETTQRREPRALVVAEARVVLEERVAAGPRRVLEPGDHVGIDHVMLAVTSPLVLAAPVQLRAEWPLGEGVRATPLHLVGDYVEADAG